MFTKNVKLIALLFTTILQSSCYNSTNLFIALSTSILNSRQFCFHLPLKFTKLSVNLITVHGQCFLNTCLNNSKTLKLFCCTICNLLLNSITLFLSCTFQYRYYFADICFLMPYNLQYILNTD